MRIVVSSSVVPLTFERGRHDLAVLTDFTGHRPKEYGRVKRVVCLLECRMEWEINAIENSKVVNSFKRRESAK